MKKTDFSTKNCRSAKKITQLRDRSLFMAGVGAEEKLFLAQNFFLPNHCQTENFIYPTLQEYNFFSAQP